MANLLEVCNGLCCNENQKKYFWKKVLETIWKDEEPLAITEKSMREVWVRYDLGGISCGRSLRSALIELGFDFLEYGYIQDLKHILVILIAMYHSSEYINTHKWFDYTVTDEDLPITERAFLVSVVMVLGCTDIPDISICTDKYVLEVINSGREKISMRRMAD